MKLFLALVSLVAFVLAACGRHDSPPGQAVQPPSRVSDASSGDRPADLGASVPRAAPERAATSVPAPPGPAAALDSTPLDGAIHAVMTTQLRKFIQQYGRMPTDFSEFASVRMDSVPFPPDGMKYVIDYATREVKVVKK